MLMKNIDNSQKLPAGLIDSGVEFFVHQNEIYCLHNGATFTFENIPQHIIQLIREDMFQYPKALKALKDWDINDPEAQIKQYIMCRFGGFDNNSDISSDGKILHTEYINCGRRGQCPYEGKLCASIEVKQGVLSRREIAVLKLIGAGKLDKEIADELDISRAAIRNHKDHISQKAGVERKASLAILAHQLNLV